MRCTNDCYDSTRITWAKLDEIIRCECCSIRVEFKETRYCALCANAILEELAKAVGVEVV